ncbi:HAMP domain-containing sensor histidine kinase [Variovorax sp. WS11]|uniref:sensor histidine kinase n=1 Tax=Variovorax sp. WS11 TaxID=1105204 RepID=UPI0013D98EA5|nr:HAMP domain-containing sensor histidine kinase [Variovorax sp. WS11]NDZ12709.1 HAMP domain-containing histidine kinase [Variovorax sp. WS11]
MIDAFARRRMRLIIRMSFLVLIIGLGLLLFFALRDQRQISYLSARTDHQNRMRHVTNVLLKPAGELLLKDPQRLNLTSLIPPELPSQFDAIDEPAKVLPLLGACLEDVPGKGSVCVAVPKGYATGGTDGRIYVVGTFNAKELTPHVERFHEAHRLLVDLSVDSKRRSWTVPVQKREQEKDKRLQALEMRGYFISARGYADRARPAFETAWIARGDCVGGQAAHPGCLRQWLYGMYIPRSEWDAGYVTDQQRPPPSRSRLSLRVRVMAPGPSTAVPLFDSDNRMRSASSIKLDLRAHIRPEEEVEVNRIGRVGDRQFLFAITHDRQLEEKTGVDIADRLMRLLPLKDDPMGDKYDGSVQFSSNGATYEVREKLQLYEIRDEVAKSAAHLSLYVALMLGAMVAAYIAIEVGVLRRVLLITRRTATVARAVRADGSIEKFDFSDLRGRDELGVLASGIDGLLQRISADVHRETIRVENERRILRAIGHELRSPLQGLSAVHASDSEGRSYVDRMIAAFSRLYGKDSAEEAIASTTFELDTLDLDDFLKKVARNAPVVGIENVVYIGKGPATVRADEGGLEQVVSHLLDNARRYRPQGTPIILQLQVIGVTAQMSFHNQGPQVPSNLIEHIFDYGVSDKKQDEQTGQGLFVAKTYLAKMGGAISVSNRDEGVTFEIRLPLDRRDAES